MNKLKLALVTAAFAVGASAASAAVVTEGPGGFDDGWATEITFENDNSIAKRGTSNDRDDPLNALGATDGEFFEIGIGSTIDLTFGTLFDTSVNVIEVTFGNPANFVESANVYVGVGGSFTLVGQIFNTGAQDPGTTLSLNRLVGGPFDTIRLTDTTVTNASTGGFDVDSVRVEPVPIPAAGLLLVGGLGLMGAMRARKKAS